MEEKKKKLRVQKIPLLVTTVLIIAGLAAGYFIYKNDDDNPKQSLPVGWVEYKNEKYGFKFDYSQEWGDPKLTVEESVPATGIIKSSEQTGLRYIINFPEFEIKKSRFIEIKLDSEDYTNITCITDGQCSTNLAVTEDTMRVNLARATKGKFVKYDSNSYTSLSYQPPLGVLTIHQIVELPEIHVSAATASYSMTNSGVECTDGVFSESKKCITDIDYRNLNRLIKSFSSL